MMVTKENLVYAVYVCLAVIMLIALFFGRPQAEKIQSPNNDIQIVKDLNSPNGEYDYYIKNPTFQFLDIEGNVKVMKVKGLYVKIGSPVNVTCKVESIGKSFNLE